MLAVTNEQKVVVHHMDVKAVFLNSVLEEEMIMTKLESLEEEKNLMCTVKQYLYGLK